VGVLVTLWPFLKPERNRLLANAAITLALTGVDVASPLLVGMFLDALLEVLAGTPTTAPPLRPQQIIGLLVVGALLRGYLISQQLALAGKSGERVAARIRDALWNHLQLLPIDYTRQRGSGRLLMRFISDARAVQRLVTNGLVRLSQDLLLGGAILVALVVLNHRLALVVALLLPMYLAIFWWLNPRLRKESREARRRRSRLSAHLQERLAGMAIVKAFVQQSAEAERVRELNRHLARRGARRAATAGRLHGLTAMAVAGNSAAVLLLAWQEALAGRLSAGSLVAFYALIGLLTPVFQRVTVANRSFQEARISVERLAMVLAEPPESPADDTLPPVVVDNGTIVVDGLCYSYPGGPPALSDVNLVVRRGALVAIAGPNGSGKSTLLELLLRFRSPTSGTITVDGQNIADYSVASLRSQIGLVAQEAPLFDGTITENITYGLPPGVPPAQIEQAARLAGVTDVVERLDRGWETRIGTGGRVLSGGQRQRIALARALALDPPILILDEVTSALDSETEHALALTLRELARHKTVLVAAHRPSTLHMADRIYLLERGRAIDVGSYAALIERSGLFMRVVGDQVAPDPRTSGDSDTVPHAQGPDVTRAPGSISNAPA